MLVGLTSSSSLETLNGCSKQAEGIIIPTSFAPVNPDAVAAADAAAALGGSADLHSAAAWEIMMILKDVIEAAGIQATGDSIEADRRAVRDGLASLKTTRGLLGEITRTDEGEAIKPYVYVPCRQRRLDRAARSERLECGLRAASPGGPQDPDAERRSQCPITGGK